jgi:hypothetical protein
VYAHGPVRVRLRVFVIGQERDPVELAAVVWWLYARKDREKKKVRLAIGAIG